MITILVGADEDVDSKAPMKDKKSSYEITTDV